MTTLNKLLIYLNPLNRLGGKQYSTIFPGLVTLSVVIALEYYYRVVVQNPSLVRTPGVLVFLGLIIYFSFRDGIRGGITATSITIVYYFYIITSQYTNQQALLYDFETTLTFIALYLSIAVIIGGLKQRTDIFIEREAEEKNRLQTILESMPTGIISLDKTGKVTHANKQLELITGYKIPIGSILEKNPFLLAKTHSSRPSYSSLNQVLKAGKTLMRKEYLIKRKDDQKIFVQINASPIHNKHGEIIAAVATVIDISQQKELEKRKDDFINIASHELKTPLTSINLYLRSLSSRLTKHEDKQVKKIIKNIHYQTDRLQELVDDLLDVPRLQTGKMKFTKEQFILNTLLKETLKSLQPITKHQKIIFHENSLLSVLADKFRIHQVITNLITNAVKYSPADADIIVKLKKSGNKAIIGIQDRGIGIAEEEQKKIFNRLYQVTDSTGRTFPGLGLGLYISKQIIKRHKGSLWVESEQGKGSTFYFTLPILQKRSNYDKKTSRTNPYS